MADEPAGDSGVNIPAPAVVGGSLPRSFPADFEALAVHLQPDAQWRRLERGTHYTRSETMMRRHLTEYARGKGWTHRTQVWKERGVVRGLYVKFEDNPSPATPRGRAPRRRREG